MMDCNPVVKELAGNRLYQCLPDARGDTLFVLQHGTVVAEGDDRPHVSQFMDDNDLFWPSTLLPKALKSCSIYAQKTQLLNIWEKGGQQGNIRAEGMKLANSIVHIFNTQSCELRSSFYYVLSTFGLVVQGQTQAIPPLILEIAAMSYVSSILGSAMHPWRSVWCSTV